MKSIGILLSLVLLGCGDTGVGSGGDGSTDAINADAFNIDTDAAACAAQTTKVEIAPLDVLLALDTSYSMDFDGKWIAVRAALESFASDPRFSGIGVALQYFPLRAQCNVEDYAQPAVPLDVLPGVGSALIESLDKQRMAGGTPMVPMLEGMLTYARDQATQNPKHKVVILMATDGIPDSSCLAPTDAGVSNTLDHVVTVASGGLSGTPSIPTFVIGVGSELTELSQIAQAGGTNNAILVDTAQNIESAFLDALNTIRKRALSCEYPIPNGDGGLLDFGRVNVRFSDGAHSQTFVYVTNKDGCATAPGLGWYYDDVQNPSKVVLCDDICSTVKASDTGQVDVIYGCLTVIL